MGIYLAPFPVIRRSKCNFLPQVHLCGSEVGA